MNEWKLRSYGEKREEILLGVKGSEREIGDDDDDDRCGLLESIPLLIFPIPSCTWPSIDVIYK